MGINVTLFYLYIYDHQIIVMGVYVFMNTYIWIFFSNNIKLYKI